MSHSNKQCHNCRSLLQQIRFSLSIIVVLTIGLSSLPSLAMGQFVPQATDQLKPTYQKFTIPGNFEDKLNQLLGQVQNRQQFEKQISKMLDEMKSDPGKYKDLIDQAKKQYEENPVFQKQVDQLIKNKQFPNLDDLPDLNKKGEENPIIPPKSDDPKGEPNNPSKITPPKIEPGKPTTETPPELGSPDAPPPLPKPEPVPANTGEDPWQQWMKGMVEDLKDSEVGEALAESPSFRQAMLDLQKSLSADNVPGANLGETTFGDWFRNVSNLKLEQNLAFSEGWFPKMGDMPMPRLPRLNISLPNLGGPTLPMPSGGGIGSGAGIAMILAIGLIISFVALIFWMFKNSGSFSIFLNGEALKPRIGPWPVDPHQLRSRADLVKAFEYLSLLILGWRVVHWNHRQIISNIYEDANTINTPKEYLDQLALLYELAKYGPDQEPLSEEDLGQAQEIIVKLVGKTA